MTQYVKLNQVAELGPEMPMPLSHHCLVKVDEMLAIVTGGFTSNKVVSNSSFFFNIAGSNPLSWTLAPSLTLPRHSHSCGVLTGANGGPIVIVAGGDTDTDDVSTEFLAMSTSTYGDSAWEPGPNIPLKLEGTSMVATSSHDRLILIGGIKKSGSQSAALIQLECIQFATIGLAFDIACQWTLMDQKLTYPRSDYWVYFISTGTNMAFLQEWICCHDNS